MPILCDLTKKKVEVGIGGRPQILLAFYFFQFVMLIMGHFVWGHVPVKQPSFKSGPTVIKSEENDTVFLPCLVDDLGDSFIRWWKDETLVSDSRSPVVTPPSRVAPMDDGIKIDALEPEDAGEYTCEVVRPGPWSSLKLVHKVQVFYPPKIHPTPQDGYLEVLLGDRVRIGCAVSGMPPPVVSWRFKGVTMPLTGENRQSLEFTATNRMMSGIYQCEANNGIKRPAYTNIFLRILHKPEVKADKSWIHSAPGLRTSLICRIIGDPEPRIEWLFNGEPMEISAPRLTYRVRGDDHVVLIGSVKDSDFGNYTCRASNVFGTSEDVIQLSGVANPVVFKKAEGKLPSDFSFIWEVDSYSPIFEYKLLFRKQDSASGEDGPWVSLIVPADGFPSGPLHSKSYTLSGLDKFAVYEAKILSRNRFGWSNSSEVIRFALTKSQQTKEENVGDEKVLSSLDFSSSGSSQTVAFMLSSLLIFSLSIYDIS